MKLKRTTLGWLAFLLAFAMVIIPASGVWAATTADVSVTATPKYIAIADNATTIAIGAVDENTTTNTTAVTVEIDNTSSVQTDQTISVTTTTWAGGVTWAHSATATAGVDTVGLKAGKANWETPVVVENGTPNYIAENQAANTDYTYGLSLITGTFTDGVQKSITVRVTAAAG